MSAEPGRTNFSAPVLSAGAGGEPRFYVVRFQEQFRIRITLTLVKMHLFMPPCPGLLFTAQVWDAIGQNPSFVQGKQRTNPLCVCACVCV